MIEADLQPSPAAVILAIERIARRVRPARIIAFGSRARGQHKPDSDLDLLVVLPRGAKENGLAGEIYEAVGALGFSKDILISEEDRFERSRSSINSVQATAASEGVTLYENGRTDRAAIEKICR
ncbi:MAG: nucleotidyltransferase domain-containing protein [Chthoniobacterales bacterium]|nr:nucleotidyltransferase domain-containing protein [Chthoniobacterales bacterium]